MLGGKPEIMNWSFALNCGEEDTSSLIAGRMSLGGGMTAALRG